MKPELAFLIGAVGLTVIQMLVAVVGAMLQVGVPVLFGNRDNIPDIQGWAGRAARARLKDKAAVRATPAVARRRARSATRRSAASSTSYRRCLSSR